MSMDLNPPNSGNKFVCEYCNKEYKYKHSLEVHVCTKKQRFLQKNEKRVRYGFHAYNRFNRLSCGHKKDSTYEQFCNSQYYNAFVKFGSYLSNVNPLYPDNYIDYVIKNKLKIKDWCNDDVYEKYVLELLKKEPASVALERSINTMIAWAEENRSIWYHYFDHVNYNLSIWHIKDGKISPWIILNTDKGKKLLSNFDDTQLDIIFEIINPEYWLPVFSRNPTDIEMIHLLSKEFDL